MDDHNNQLKDDDEILIYQSTTMAKPYFKKKGVKKYSRELQHLIPYRSKSCSDTEMPVDTAGCFSYMLFSWMTPIVWRSFRYGLKKSDTYKCSLLDSSRVNGARITNIWESECHRKGLHNASLNSVVHRFVRTRLIMSSLFYVICLICGYLSAIVFLKNLLDFIETPHDSSIEGLHWTIALFLSEILRASAFAIMYAVGIRTAIRACSGVNAILYNKILTTRSLTNKTVGEIVNLFANDTHKIFHMIYIFPLSLGGPILAIVTIVYTWYLLGIFALVGVSVFIVVFAIQFAIAKGQSHYRKKVIESTDERVSFTTELITYIKLIKLYAWERPFSKTVFDLRQNERNLLEICQYLQCMSTSLALITPMITTIATILAYTLANHDLTSSTAFTLVMVNYVAAHGIRTLPLYVRDIINGRIAMKRIEKFLQYDDKEQFLILPLNAENSIEMKKATLAWDSYVPMLKKNEITRMSVVSTDDDKQMTEDFANKDNLPQRSSTVNATCLFDMSIDIQKGKLIGITGSVASGKTALLRSIMGQMRLINGKVAVRGLTAYVSQDAWIMNASVRDNIVFGYEFNTKKFYETINCCGLSYDIASLPMSDQTEIGERGVTLSGGQKQRLSLARAFYADRDIYLLDDPLSSVDRTLGKEIFNNCIRTALRGKTILFVTHQIEYLEDMDSVIFMREGKIANYGTHNDLMNSDSDYKNLVETSKVTIIDNEHFETSNKINTEMRDLSEIRFSSPDWGDVLPLSFSGKSSDTSTSEVIDMESGENHDHTFTHVSSAGLVADERIETGDIAVETYMSYIKAGGGFIICSFVLIWLAFQAITASFTNWWLGYWISQGSGNDTDSVVPEGHDIIVNNPDIGYYQRMYGLSIGIMICSTVALGYMFTKITYAASSKLHDKVFKKIVSSPMRFFDTVPIGRILNIFAHDMDEIDTHLPTALDGFLQRLMIVFCNFFLIIMIFPWFLIPFIVMAVVFWLIHRMFRGAIRDFKRIENTMRSPIFSHVTETIEGLSTIKAFNKQNEFTRKFTDLIDAQSAPNFLYYCSMRWLSTRMDILCIFILLLTAVFSFTETKGVGAAFAGLALVLSMQLSGLLQFVVRLGIDCETRFTSVERIQMQIEALRPESDVSAEKRRKPHDLWPERGRISFREVTMRYRPGLQLALKGLTFDINPQEKIGIIGRTGAGKSSIASVLFRLVEINSGTIHIDNIDISTVGLEDLRSRISIIPQDPVLFRGSVRQNLDPFNQFKIQNMMDALTSVHMKHKINTLKGGINKCITGINFSTGERQLLCMARALLRQSKILVLDEATASMDGETEQLINETLINVFKDCTVLKIAHRIQTVQNCDRIMVLRDGIIIEFDTPSALMGNPQSYFSQLISSNASL